MTYPTTDRRVQDRRQDLQAMGATAEQFRHRAKLAEQQRDELLVAARRAEALLAQVTPAGLLAGSPLYQLRRAIAFAATGPAPGKRLVIAPHVLGHGFDVTDELGRCCDGLSWDEMLGQVALLTIPLARVGHGYAMHTPEQWHEMRTEQEKRWRAAERRSS